MGNLERRLQEKVKKREEEKQLMEKDRTLTEQGQMLSSSVVYLEKKLEESQDGWYLSSYKPLEGKGLWGKLGVFRKKVQRKALYWYIDPVCDDQSAYNRKISEAMEALEGFAKAQADWNRTMEKQHQKEMGELKRQLAEVKEENARLKKQMEKRMGEQMESGKKGFVKGKRWREP